MRILKVESNSEGGYFFDHRPNQANKTLLFLAGMRGSGKTSELAKYAKMLNSPGCFFVVTCNVDEELDVDNIQYMDILIFHLEKLLDLSGKAGLNLDNSIVDSMQKWFEDRVKEINTSLKGERSAEIEMDSTQTFPGLLARLLGITAKLKLGLSVSRERAETIRTNLKTQSPGRANLHAFGGSFGEGFF